MTFRVFSTYELSGDFGWQKRTDEVCVDHKVHMTVVHRYLGPTTYHKLKFCDKSCEQVELDLSLEGQKLILQFIEGKKRRGGSQVSASPTRRAYRRAFYCDIEEFTSILQRM